MSNPQAYSPDTLSEDKVTASPSTSSVFSGTTVANPIVAPVTTGYVDLEQVKRSQFKSLAGQFACYVGISTFTASLVVGFISLSRAIIDKPPTLPLSSRRSEFEVGLALGMIAIGLHIGVVIVGIRAGALCLRRTAMPGDTEAYVGEFIKDLQTKHFYRYIRYCERLQLLGSFFFVATLIYMTFLMFDVEVLQWLLCGSAIVGLLTLLSAGVWRMSVIRESIECVAVWFGKRLGGQTKAQRPEDSQSPA